MYWIIALLIGLLTGYLFRNKDQEKIKNASGFLSQFCVKYANILIALLMAVVAYVISNELHAFAENKTTIWFVQGLKYSSPIEPAEPQPLSILAKMGWGTETDLSEENKPSSKIDYKVVETLNYRSAFFESVFTPDSIRSFHRLTLKLPRTKNCRVDRMYQQLTDVTFSAYNHLMTAREFMAQNYICLTMAALYYSAAFAFLVYITKAGLKDTKSWVLIMLVMSFAIATFFFGLTSIFKHEQNVNSNLALYAAHINLEQQMRSSIAGSDYVVKYSDVSCSELTDKINENKKADTLIRHFDSMMRDLNKIELGFDAAGVLKLRESLEENQTKLTK